MPSGRSASTGARRSWAVRGLIGTDGAETLPLFEQLGRPGQRDETDADLPLMPPGEDGGPRLQDADPLAEGAPVSFMRQTLDRARHRCRADELDDARDGQRVEVAGLVLVRQRPGTASGVIFATLEDETGIANIVIWTKVFDKHRHVVLGSRMLAVRGKLQSEGLVIHVVAESFTDMTADLVALAGGQSFGDAALARGDEGNAAASASANYDLPRVRRKKRLAAPARAALPEAAISTSLALAISWSIALAPAPRPWPSPRPHHGSTA